MSTKKDFYLVTLIGFLVGVIFPLPAESFKLHLTVRLIVFSILGFTIFAPLAFFVLKQLSRFWKPFYQIGKFAATGTLNSFIDLAILNIFLIATNISAGFLFIVFKAIAFLGGVINSYFWNKFWTFESRGAVTISETVRFFALTLIGAFINTGVAYVIVTYIHRFSFLNANGWANIAAVIAIFATMAWNFVTYKIFVFPEPKPDNA